MMIKLHSLVNGRVVEVIENLEQFGGTLAIGVEPNSIGHFDDLTIRDTSVRE